MSAAPLASTPLLRRPPRCRTALPRAPAAPAPLGGARAAETGRLCRDDCTLRLCLQMMYYLGTLLCATANDLLRPTPNDGPWNVALQQRDAHKRHPRGFTGGDEWRQPAIDFIISKCRLHPSKCESMDIYEWGVFIGISMRALSVQLKDAAVHFRTMWGFDSFQGLPGETGGSEEHPEVERFKFFEGAFSAAGTLGLYSYTKLRHAILHYVDDTRVHLVRGYYNESLNAERAERARPALYVDVDCDLYTSTFTALDWMFANRLIVPGTLIGYDDWVQGGPTGEQRAHHELMTKYAVRVTRIPSRARWPVFLVTSVGNDQRLWWHKPGQG